jgi:hypothetical protein
MAIILKVNKVNLFCIFCFVCFLIKMLHCFQVRVDEDGKILDMKGNVCENAGSHWNEHVSPFTKAHWKSCYDSSTWNVKISDVKTDLPTNVYCRSPGKFCAIQLCGEKLDGFNFFGSFSWYF